MFFCNKVMSSERFHKKIIEKDIAANSLFLLKRSLF